MAKTGLNYGIYKALMHSELQLKFMSILLTLFLWQLVNLLQSL